MHYFRISTIVVYTLAVMQSGINHKSVGTSLPIKLLARIDRERGDISRSRFILRMLEKIYSTEDVKEEAKLFK